MPYTVQRRGRGTKPWKIVRADGKIVGASRSRSAARASVRARMSAEGGQTSTYGGGGRFARAIARRNRPRKPAAIARRVLGS